MVISPRRVLCAVLAGLTAIVLAGCAPSDPRPTPSPSAAPIDFTAAGNARAMVQKLLSSAGSTKALLVKITAHTVEVTALNDEQPITWAYRDGTTAQVASDLQYVDQAVFDVNRFNISDVGALFRAAGGQSASVNNQTLTIVDSSGGDVAMSVSTQPETHTVFFNPDGSLLPVLDFDTLAGVKAGIADAVGERSMVYAITVISDQSVYAEFPGANATTVRRTRTAMVPPVTTVRSSASRRQFAASRVNPAVIWRVVTQMRGSGDVANRSKWSVTIDNRDKQTAPRMYFTFGFSVLVTEMDGTPVNP